MWEIVNQNNSEYGHILRIGNQSCRGGFLETEIWNFAIDKTLPWIDKSIH